jgi:hypothetical protein
VPSGAGFKSTQQKALAKPGVIERRMLAQINLHH